MEGPARKLPGPSRVCLSLNDLHIRSSTLWDDDERHSKILGAESRDAGNVILTNALYRKQAAQESTTNTHHNVGLFEIHLRTRPHNRKHSHTVQYRSLATRSTDRAHCSRLTRTQTSTTRRCAYHPTANTKRPCGVNHRAAFIR